MSDFKKEAKGDSAGPEKEKERNKLKEIVSALEKEMRCNCDLDNWEPERTTGHSHVCRIHKAALDRDRGEGNHGS